MATEIDGPAPVPAPELMQIIMEAVRTDASDTYIKVGVPPMYRIDGITQALTPTPLSPAQARGLVESIMTPEQKAEYRKVSEMNLALAVEGIARFRVNAYIQRNSCAMVMRRIKSDIPQLENLGLPARLQDL